MRRLRAWLLDRLALLALSLLAAGCTGCCATAGPETSADLETRGSLDASAPQQATVGKPPRRSRGERMAQQQRDCEGAALGELLLLPATGEGLALDSIVLTLDSTRACGDDRVRVLAYRGAESVPLSIRPGTAGHAEAEASVFATVSGLLELEIDPADRQATDSWTVLVSVGRHGPEGFVSRETVSRTLNSPREASPVSQAPVVVVPGAPTVVCGEGPADRLASSAVPPAESQEANPTGVAPRRLRLEYVGTYLFRSAACGGTASESTCTVDARVILSGRDAKAVIDGLIELSPTFEGSAETEPLDFTVAQGPEPSQVVVRFPALDRSGTLRLAPGITADIPEDVFR